MGARSSKALVFAYFMNMNGFQGRRWYGLSVKRHSLETHSMLLDVQCTFSNTTPCKPIIGKTEVNQYIEYSIQYAVPMT